MRFQRVHIIGGAGSGKTTLAKTYAESIAIAHHELDNLYYIEASARTKRDMSARKVMLREITDTERWVVEGIFWQPWIQPSLDRADKIVVLAVSRSTRNWRVIKRHFRLLAQASLKEYPRFFPTLLELLRHNKTYDEGPLQETLKMLEPYADKVSVCRTNAEAIKVLEPD